MAAGGETGASSETGAGLDCGGSSLVHPAQNLVKNSANELNIVEGKVKQKHDFGYN